jgi:hypothetical protein
MHRQRLITAALAALILTAPVAWAQRGGGRGFGGAGGGLMLLGQKSVQEELKLSDEQISKVTARLEEQRGAFAELRDLDRAERAAKMQERNKANEATLKDVLTANQLKRLKQIALQQRGMMALVDDEVADAVGLSAEQKDQVRSISREMRGAFQAGEDREAMRKKFEEARAAASTKLDALLSSEQKAKWKELTGEPFRGEIQRPQGLRRNREARALSPGSGPIAAVNAESSAANPRALAWNRLVETLGSQAAHAPSRFSTDEEVLQLTGVRHPRRTDAVKIHRKAHRRAQHPSRWPSHQARLSGHDPQWVRDDLVVLSSDGDAQETRTAERHFMSLARHDGDTPIPWAGAHPSPRPHPAQLHRKAVRQSQRQAHGPRHRAVHRHGGPRFHVDGRRWPRTFGHFAAHRRPPSRGPWVGRFNRHPGPPPAFAARHHHRPNRIAERSMFNRHPGPHHFARHQDALRGGHRPGPFPPGKFTGFRSGGHHMHMSGWRRPSGHRQGDLGHEERPQGDRHPAKHRDSEHGKRDARGPKHRPHPGPRDRD